MIPGLVDVATNWDFLLVSQLLELFVDKLVGSLESVDFFVGFLHLLHLEGWVHKDAIGLVIVHMYVHILTWNRLQVGCGTITEVLRKWNRQIFLGYLEVLDVREHCRVVIIELGRLILQPNYLEALTTNVATMDWTLTHEVIHLLVCVRIILDSWAHTDDNTP